MFKSKLDQHRCPRCYGRMDTDLVPEDQEIFRGIMKKAKMAPGKGKMVIWLCVRCTKKQGIEKEDTNIMELGYYRRKDE